MENEIMTEDTPTPEESFDTKTAAVHAVKVYTQPNPDLKRWKETAYNQAVEVRPQEGEVIVSRAESQHALKKAFATPESKELIERYDITIQDLERLINRKLGTLVLASDSAGETCLTYNRMPNRHSKPTDKINSFQPDYLSDAIYGGFYPHQEWGRFIGIEYPTKYYKHAWDTCRVDTMLGENPYHPVEKGKNLYEELSPEEKERPCMPFQMDKGYELRPLDRPSIPVAYQGTVPKGVMRAYEKIRPVYDRIKAGDNSLSDPMSKMIMALSAIAYAPIYHMVEDIPQMFQRFRDYPGYTLTRVYDFHNGIGPTGFRNSGDWRRTGEEIASEAEKYAAIDGIVHEALSDLIVQALEKAVVQHNQNPDVFKDAERVLEEVKEIRAQPRMTIEPFIPEAEREDPVDHSNVSSVGVAREPAENKFQQEERPFIPDDQLQAIKGDLTRRIAHAREKHPASTVKAGGGHDGRHGAGAGRTTVL